MKPSIKNRFFINTIVCLFLSLTIFSSADSNDKTKSGSTNTLLLAKSEKDTNVVLGVLPYELEFVPNTYSGFAPLLNLQSYSATVTNDGSILVIGGRRQGLHTFMGAPAKNFIKDSSNNFLYVINPANGQSWSFDVNKLPANLSAPLQSTNQQFYHDRSSGIAYLVGGYGWKADLSNMVTFNTIISFNVDKLVSLIKTGGSAPGIAAVMKSAQDDRFAVTGGELFKMNGNFYLVFGQQFNGQYRAFGGSDFSQKYTEQVRVFTLNPNTLNILTYGATTNTDPDKPFHRRDGNIIDDIDPATGKPRITAFGGVFQNGAVLPYTYPVYINSPAPPIVDRSHNQRFSQYECPVITVYDSNAQNPTVYHSFFGGIGHYYYYQTQSQKAAFDTVSNEHRNDGFPFVSDITTFLQSANGNYQEFIHMKPIPGNRLLGSSIGFLETPNLVGKGFAYDNGVIRLSAIPNGSRQLIGYIYGGIEAENPLPLKPNTGTFVTNTLFSVYLTRTSTAAIPANKGFESKIDAKNIMRR